MHVFRIIVPKPEPLFFIYFSKSEWGGDATWNIETLIHASCVHAYIRFLCPI